LAWEGAGGEVTGGADKYDLAFAPVPTLPLRYVGGRCLGRLWRSGNAAGL